MSSTKWENYIEHLQHLLFDKEGKLVITKRAKEKMLWPGDWDGTFASHPRESETYVSSGERRMPEEVGD